MKKLTAKEEEVMGFFWDKGPLYVKQLIEFYVDPRPHFNTLSTFVRALEKKKYVSHRAQGKTYLYFALISRQEYNKITVKNVVDKYFDSSTKELVSMLLTEGMISKDELKELVCADESAAGQTES